MQKHGEERFASFLLLLTAVIWGGGFVVTKVAVDVGFPPSFVLLTRFFLGTFFMVVIFYKEVGKGNKNDLFLGTIAGGILFIAFILQTAGVKYTTPSNNALITATNVVMVPFIGWMITRKRPPMKTMFFSFTCFIGMIVLSYVPASGFSFNVGDILTLLCAAGYALHVSYLGITAPRVNNVFALNAVQLGVAGTISVFYFFFFEYQPITMVQIKEGGIALLFLGFFNTGLCFLMQTYGQRTLPPVKAAIFLSLEGMFGSIASVLCGYDKLSAHLLVGATIMVGSLILLEIESIPLLNRKKEQIQ